MLLPADWEVSGEVFWKGASAPSSCMNSSAQLILTARSPDGLWGYDILPAPHTAWISVEQRFDPSMPQLDMNSTVIQPQLQKMAAEFNKPGSVCRVTPAFEPKALVEEVLLPVWRPQSRVREVEPLPDMQRRYQQYIDRHLTPTPNSSMSVAAEAVRIETQTPAGAVDESLLVMSMRYVNLLHGHDNTMMHQTVLSYPVFLIRYPLGKHDEAASLFAALSGTLRTNPRWQAAMDAHAAAMSRSATQAAAQRSQIWAKTANEISDMQMEGWKRRQESGDRIQALTVDQIREVAPVRDPTDGTVYELPNHYGSYFSNPKGEILMSTNPVLEPHQLFPHEDWTRMEPAPR